MTRPQHDHSGPDKRRTRIALAAITGLVAGATRALTGWLLEHLTSGC
ncbi:hypothetical protein ACIA5C_46445 [Actinoplanes sp. NPDC051343]